MMKKNKKEPVIFDVPDCVGTFLHEYPYGFDIKIVHDDLNTCDAYLILKGIIFCNTG